MGTEHIYHFQFWMQGEDRPTIDFQLSENDIRAWGASYQAVVGRAPKADYSPVQFRIERKGINKWHAFDIAGTFGLVSQTLVDAIGTYFLCYFDLLPATVNGFPFYFLRQHDSLDCLNRADSTIIPFRDNPGSIMQIDKYRFYKELIPDPSVFPIPEMNFHLFATDSIKSILEPLHLKGIYFVDAEL